MKLKEAIQRERRVDRDIALCDMEAKQKFLEHATRIADLVIELEQKRLANGVVVEENVMWSMSMLHRLGFDQEKVNL